MDSLILALGPAFAAGFAIQRLLELLDPLLDQVRWIKEHKKIALGIISLVAGLILAAGIGLRVLQPLGVANDNIILVILDVIVTALIISAGTDGINPIVKFLGYSKEDRKAEAAEKKPRVGEEKIEEISKAV